MVFGGLFCINLAAGKPLEGRIILIKATLSNLAIHYLSIFKIPSKVAKEHDKYQRNFMWSRKRRRSPTSLNGKLSFN